MNRQGSRLDADRPCLTRRSVRYLKKYLDDCFSPYRVHLRRSTSSPLPWWNPCGWCTYIVSVGGTRPCTNVAVISHCIDIKFSLIAKIMTICTVNHCTTRAHVSEESIPSFCLSPRAQNQALNFFTCPSGYRFILKAQVLGKTFISGVLGT